MQKLILSVLSIFLMSWGFAGAPNVLKGSLTGKVTDDAGRPVSGATIYLADAKTGTKSDINGYYSIENLSEGGHLIEVSHIGFTSIAEKVFITENTEKNFTLSEAIIENNAVVVTGVSTSSTIKKMPFQVSVLRKADLQQNTASNIIAALAKLPGVAALSTGSAISKPFIRGLGYNRVLTVNDGVRLEGQQWGDEHGIEIDDNSVNKIEILKGPASLIYGSDAMAGVINIITNVPVQANTLQANVGAEYQTNSRLRNVYASIAANKNGFNWNLYGSKKASADYRNNIDGRVYNSKFRNDNFGGYAGRNGAWGYSHLIFSNFDMKAGLIEGERNAAGNFVKPLPGGGEAEATNSDFNSTDPGFPFQRIRHYKIASDNNFHIGSNALAVNVAYQRNRREEFGNIDDPEERALFFDLQTVTYTAKFNFAEKNGLKTSIGINGMLQQNTNRGEEQLIPDYTSSDLGGFVFLQKDWKKLTVSGGARFDNRSLSAESLKDGSTIKGAAFDKSFNNFSGSAGLAYQANRNINLKLNIARAFRAPSIPELASNGAHEGTNRYEYGENNLKSETSTQLDAAVEMNNEHFSLNVAGYINAFDNFIFYRRLKTTTGADSTVNVDGDDLFTFQFDSRKATLAGGEISLDIHPHPIHWLHFQNTFSIVSGRFSKAIEGTRNLPYIPAPRLITELRANLAAPLTYLKNFYAKLELDNTFSQNNAFTAFNTETNTPGYSLLNTGVGTEVVNAKGNTIFTINFGALNITDKAYQNHLSRLKYGPENPATGRIGIYNPGRNFSLKVSVPMKWGI